MLGLVVPAALLVPQLVQARALVQPEARVQHAACSRCRGCRCTRRRRRGSGRCTAGSGGLLGRGLAAASRPSSAIAAASSALRARLAAASAAAAAAFGLVLGGPLLRGLPLLGGLPLALVLELGLLDSRRPTCAVRRLLLGLPVVAQIDPADDAHGRAARQRPYGRRTGCHSRLTKCSLRRGQGHGAADRRCVDAGVASAPDRCRTQPAPWCIEAARRARPIADDLLEYGGRSRVTIAHYEAAWERRTPIVTCATARMRTRPR